MAAPEHHEDGEEWLGGAHRKARDTFHNRPRFRQHLLDVGSPDPSRRSDSGVSVRIERWDGRCGRPSRSSTRSWSWTTGARTARQPPRMRRGRSSSAGTRTAERVRRCGTGWPSSFAQGFTHVAFVDADGQHDPADLPRLLAAAAGGADFVIGSRLRSPETMPAKNYWANTIGDKVLARMTGLPVRGRAVRLSRRLGGAPPAAPARLPPLRHRERDPRQGGAARPPTRDRPRADDLRGRAAATTGPSTTPGLLRGSPSGTKRWVGSHNPPVSVQGPS